MSSRRRSSTRRRSSARALGDAEHRAQDDLERHRLHPGAQPVGLADRPALDLLRRHIRHQLAVALHPLAVEGGQHQLTLPQVRAVVEQQHRARAEHRQEDAVRLTRVQQAGVASEHLLDSLRVGRHHPRALVGDLQREHVAEPRLAGVQHPLRTAKPDRALDGPGEARPRGKADRRISHTERYRLTYPPGCQAPNPGTSIVLAEDPQPGRTVEAQERRSSLAAAGPNCPPAQAAAVGPQAAAGPQGSR